MGRVPYLERVIIASLGKISRVMKALKSWAIHSKLKASRAVYQHGNYTLRFSKTGQSHIETAYSTHYVLIKPKTKKESFKKIEAA